MKSIDVDELKIIFSKVLNVNVLDIGMTTALHTLPEWDSLNHMNLVTALEEHFSIEFDQAEVESMINFHIVCSTIEACLD